MVRKQRTAMENVRGVASLAVVVGVVWVVIAANKHGDHRGPHYLAQQKGGVAIWMSASAMERGAAIAEAGGWKNHADLITSQISCIADSGSPVAVTEWGWETSRVLVVGGLSDGCEGVVQNNLVD